MAVRDLTASEDAALSLASAVVRASAGPLLLLDGDLAIIEASGSFRDAFGFDPAEVRGTRIGRLGDGEWANARLEPLLAATLSESPQVRVVEIDLAPPGAQPRRLVIHAQRLAYLDLDNVRIMVAVSDVTQARADQQAKAEAEEHNLVRLQEVRHRVSNSLQIVASLLLQDARKARSEEAKTRLREAHQRVMSVAALERRLADRGVGEVELRAYLAGLCESITASMVGDPGQVTVAVIGPGGVVDARTSLSLGLIVTELVINALKHAFPDGRHGAITVDCVFPGPNWTLAVSDNGVGVPTDQRDAHVGLGATIVRALAKELGATVEVESASPGTRVTVARTAIALVDPGRRLETEPRVSAASHSAA